MVITPSGMNSCSPKYPIALQPSRQAEPQAASASSSEAKPFMIIVCSSVQPNIARILRESLDYATGHTVAETKQHVIDEINTIDGMEVEYYEIVDALTMQPVADWSDTPQAVGCVTVYMGDVRLIDNIKYQAR